mmetsp:Transcript_11986/g.25027  ORF Transcript_11986/g.25027 Transcript_11986/m.25027 type:complete len:476 (+) Transcript_11986:2152-3579(+)
MDGFDTVTIQFDANLLILILIFLDLGGPGWDHVDQAIIMRIFTKVHKVANGSTFTSETSTLGDHRHHVLHADTHILKGLLEHQLGFIRFLQLVLPGLHLRSDDGRNGFLFLLQVLLVTSALLPQPRGLGPRLVPFRGHGLDLLHLLLQGVLCRIPGRLCRFLSFCQGFDAFLLETFHLGVILVSGSLQNGQLVLQVLDLRVFVLPLQCQNRSMEDLSHANLCCLLTHLLAVLAGQHQLFFQLCQAFILGTRVVSPVLLDLQNLQAYRVTGILEPFDLTQTRFHQHRQGLLLLLLDRSILHLRSALVAHQIHQLILLLLSLFGTTKVLDSRLQPGDLQIQLLQSAVAVVLHLFQLLHLGFQFFHTEFLFLYTGLGAYQVDASAGLGVRLHVFQGLLRFRHLLVRSRQLLFPFTAFLLDFLASHGLKLSLQLGILLLQLSDEFSRGIQLLLHLHRHLFGVVCEAECGQRVVVVNVCR